MRVPEYQYSIENASRLLWGRTITRGLATVGVVVLLAGAQQTSGEEPSVSIECVPHQGSVDLANNGGGSLSATPDWTADGLESGASWRGYSVSTAGDVNADGFDDVIAGSPFYPAGNQDFGLVLVYHGAAAGLSDFPDWWAVGPSHLSQWGTNVAAAGDVNGDGYDDVIFSAASGKTPKVVKVAHGGPAGLSALVWSYTLDPGSQPFTFPVAGAGDVNGDGYDDVVLAHAGLAADAGRAFVFFGSSEGLSAQPDWGVTGDPGVRLGFDVAGGGDVNGDGYDDVIVGVAGDPDGQLAEGAVYVYHGSPVGPSLSPDWIELGPPEPFSFFGQSVGNTGDVDGDGFGDVIVGAWGFSTNGLAMTFLGSSNGLSEEPQWAVEGPGFTEDLGFDIGSAGDTNGDGFDDVVVTSPGFDAGGSISKNYGAARVFLGSAEGLATTASWMVIGEDEFGHFGQSVNTAGDVNGDGAADVIVGAHMHDDFAAQVGEAFVFHGILDPCTEGGQSDLDADGVVCSDDNCPDVANPAQQDTDLDKIGDACDICPAAHDPGQLDADGDGSGAACDCADSDPATHPEAPEVNDGEDNQCPGDAGHDLADEISGEVVFEDETTLAWPPQAGAARYEVARASAADFIAGCQTTSLSRPPFPETTLPVPGEVLYYLVRPISPNVGSWGVDSAETPRTVPCSPLQP